MGLLSPLSSKPSPLTVLLYGPAGTGKTTAALTLANLGKVVVIDTEAGIKQQALTAQGIQTENIYTWPDTPGDLTFEAFDALITEVKTAEPGTFAGVVLDSFTETARRLLERQAAQTYAKKMAQGKSPERFQIDLADHGVLSSQLRYLLRRLRDLNLHLVLTALERRDQDEQDGMVHYGPALGPAVANDTVGLVDMVGWTQVEAIGKEGESAYTGTFVPMKRHVAKDRLGVLPPKMINPSMERILGYLDGTITREEDPLQKAAAQAAS